MTERSNRKAEPEDTERIRRRHHDAMGRRAEFYAALALMAKGYWILERRHKARTGEVDLIAVRGRRLAFVEVKRRRSFEDAAHAISDKQADRMARTAMTWLAKHPKYRTYVIGLDAFLFAPRSWPRHLPDACQRVRNG